MPTTTSTRSPAQPAAPAPRQTSPVAPRRSSSGPTAIGGAPFVRLASLRPASGSGPPGVRSVVERDNGDSLSLPVRGALEQSLGVDLAPVRVHTSASAASVVDGMGARAFAYGTHIFLGRKERADDVALLAHEVAHVVQQQGGAAVQRKGGPEAGSGLEREADDVSTAVVSGQSATVTGRTGARPQFGFGDWVSSGVRAIGRGVSAVAGAVGDIVGAALNFIRDRAQNIPGYSMLAFILGRDPITQQPVERNAVNLIRAIMGLWPAGNLVFEALQRYGIIDRVGSWLGQQLNTLGMAASAIRQALDRFIGTLGASDILNLGAVWDRARRIFSEPIERASQFVRGLVTGVLGFIRDAVLRPIARLAEGTRGYDLLRLVLGQDPITGDPYPRTPENMIGGFMRLIGQEEKWRHLQESRAIPRVWAWFQQQFGTLLGFVQQVPGLFVRAWQTLQISDLLDLGGAFSRMRAIFGGFISNFLSWAGAAALQIMMFIFEALAPGAMPVLRRAQSVIRTIISDPIRFVGNLVRAGLKGFEQFRDNIRTHLINGLVGWLTGALTGAGLQLPARWDLRGILSLVLQILGLTWQNIRTKLVRVMGETAVTVLETTFDIVMTLVRDGPAAAWEKILEQLSNLQEMVFGQIREWVTRTVVGQAVIRILSMLNPAGAVIQAIIATYNTIMFFRERLQQIIQVVESFFNSIANIAAGNIGAAADRVEQTMARIIPVVISFLARLIGLGGISDTIRNIIARIRAPIDRALDRVVDWIAAQARRLGRAIMSGARRAVAGVRRMFERTVNIGGETHTLRASTENGRTTLLMASNGFREVPVVLQGIRTHYVNNLFPRTGMQTLANQLDTRLNAVQTRHDAISRDIRDADAQHLRSGTPDRPNPRRDQLMNDGVTELRAMLTQIAADFTFGGGSSVAPGSHIVLTLSGPPRGAVVSEIGLLVHGHFGLRATNPDGSNPQLLTYEQYGRGWTVPANGKPAFIPFSGSTGTGTRTIRADVVPNPLGRDPSVDPPGYDSTTLWNRRGHLVAKVFGGPGGASNLVAMTFIANQTNAGIRSVEDDVRDDIRHNGSVFDYKVTPRYASPRIPTRDPPSTVDVVADEKYPNNTNAKYSKTVVNTV